jgi:transposase-like protein
MAKVQKVYTREFKEEAVRLAQTSGKSIAQVARELGISDTSIHPMNKLVWSSSPTWRSIIIASDDIQHLDT